MWDLESMGTSKTIEMCQTPWTCGAGKNKIKNSKRLLHQCLGWSLSCTRVCTHMSTFTHVTQVPREEDNLKELNIFIVVSFYFKRFPKERRGWAGGAKAGDTAWNQERWACTRSSWTWPRGFVLPGDVAQYVIFGCKGQNCTGWLFLCLVIIGSRRNTGSAWGWFAVGCEGSSAFTPQTPERTMQVPPWERWFLGCPEPRDAPWRRLMWKVWEIQNYWISDTFPVCQGAAAVDPGAP